ncbi:amidohydrolase family protein [Lentisalinibacter orientalis]|uniref:amidohydrolase family protein n=1 Tax=Lentisalinibacter orientalis TaxID=2992241 RepID=UPI00386EEB1F
MTAYKYPAAVFSVPFGRRRRVVVVPLLLALMGASVAGAHSSDEPAAAVSARADSLVIHVGRLLSVPGEGVREQQTIIVEDGRIAAIEDGYISPADAGRDGADVIDLSTRFVLPGLIDSHVHITSTPSSSFQLDRVTQSDAHRAIWGAYNAKVTLLAGFTTVRDPAGFRGDSFDSVFALRDGIRAGKIPGPRLLVAGQGVGSLASQGDFLGYRHEVMDLFEARSMCSGPYQCRDAVRYLVKRGADFIKMVPTGWATGSESLGDQMHMFPDELEAVVQTAHRFGRRVTAHATGLEGAKAAIRAGTDAIEHGRVLDAEAVRMMVDNDVYLVPTLLVTTTFERASSNRLPGSARNVSASEGPSLAPIVAKWFESVRLAHKAGVKIAFGTDSAITPHGQNAGEFALLVERVGMSPEEAIMTATVHAAANLGLSDQVGRLEEGMWADIIAVEGNPLEDVRLLEDVDFVMREGIAYKIAGRELVR